jgi:hypothetical protein
MSSISTAASMFSARCVLSLLNRHEIFAIHSKQRSDLLYKHPQRSVAGSPENNYIFLSDAFVFATWHMVIGCNL